MNNRHIPFSTPVEEMHALQRRSEDYEAKLSALRLKRPIPELAGREIRYIRRLNQECQRAIAFYFGQQISGIQNANHD